MMDVAGHGQGHNYRQLAEEIGEVLSAAAETAEKMQEEACLQAERIRGEAEEQLRTACAEARRILDEARMEADMLRAEAEWQAQEIVAHARRQAAERIAGADSRMAEVEKVESRVLDRLDGVGQVLADSLATLRSGATESAAAAAAPYEPYEPQLPPADADADADAPSAKVYFVEFPPNGAADPIAGEASDPDPADPADVADVADPVEIVLSDEPGASLFTTDEERSEWGPPSELPAWWTRGGAQG
jgi:hypothetical protein